MGGVGRLGVHPSPSSRSNLTTALQATREGRGRGAATARALVISGTACGSLQVFNALTPHFFFLSKIQTLSFRMTDASLQNEIHVVPPEF
jgi:hypothetical protein